ncbi:MAG: SDR family oxidoreductase [Novosphingobium sp.]|nr:SDR family oxidoreductase [Novosphingobium sp.]
MGILEGKAVVITGSGRGIGAACAMGAAMQGASVVVNDVDADVAEASAEAICVAGGTAHACVADIADWDDAGRLIASCTDTYGRIDGLVNNAGLFHLSKPWDFEPKAARAMIDVNVLGTFHCAAHAAKAMVAQGSGAIVNVVSGAHMGVDSLGVYGATKGAVASMVYGWAIDLKGTGVRINAISPFGKTRMADATSAYRRSTGGKDRSASFQPPEDNSPLVEFLLSDRSEGVNGQLVRIDSGELQLYTHPALLLPSLRRESWTAEQIAEAFDGELRERLVPCGVLGMEQGPVPLTSGFWSR